MDRQITFAPANKKQRQFLESIKRYSLLSGAVGSGKSFLGCLKGFTLNLIYPGNRGLICRKELSSLKTSTLMTLLEKVIPEEMIVKIDKVDGFIIHKTMVPGVNSRIDISGLDKKADQQYPTKIGSTEYGWIFADETVELTEDDWQILPTRLRYQVTETNFYKARKVMKNLQNYTYREFNKIMVRQVFGATNPDSPNHYLHKFFYGNESKDRLLIQMNSYDNPYLDPEYLKQLEETLTGIRKERLLFGKWVQAEGVIYDCFSYEKNVIDIDMIQEATKYKYFFGGADSNFPIPRAGLIFGVRPDGEIHVIREFYQGGTHPEDLGQWYNEFAEHFKISVDVFHDPSDPEAIVKIGSFPSVFCEKAKNPVIPGIDAVYHWFETGKLKIDRSCIELIKYLQSYSWKKGSKQQPNKVDDHLCFVGNTKVLTLDGYKKIKNINDSDYVLTRTGWQKVLVSLETGIEEIFEIELSSGKKIKCTGNHPIFVKEKGFVRADALRYFYKLLSVKDTTWYQKHLMEEVTIKEKTDIGERVEDSTIFTGMFGLNIMEKFQNIFKYIIKMGIKTITKYPILNVYQSKNIKQNTQQKKEIQNNSKLQENLQKFGTLVKRVTNGIQNIGRNLWENVLLKKNIYAFSVEKNLFLKLHKERNIVTQTVKQEIFVIGIKKLKNKRKVYNLYVENSHEYFVEDILVSNCDALRYGIFTYKTNNSVEVQNIPVPVFM